jgi:hypothetical protein
MKSSRVGFMETADFAMGYDPCEASPSSSLSGVLHLPPGPQPHRGQDWVKGVPEAPLRTRRSHWSSRNCSGRGYSVAPVSSVSQDDPASRWAADSPSPPRVQVIEAQRFSCSATSSITAAKTSSRVKSEVSIMIASSAGRVGAAARLASRSSRAITSSSTER